MANCSVTGVNSNQTLLFDSSCTKDNRCIGNDFSMIELKYSGNNDVLGFKVTNTINNAIVRGMFTLKSVDKKYCCTVKESKEPVL